MTLRFSWIACFNIYCWLTDSSLFWKLLYFGNLFWKLSQLWPPCQALQCNYNIERSISPQCPSNIFRNHTVTHIFNVFERHWLMYQRIKIPTINSFQRPFSIIIRWQSKGEWRRKMTLVLVFSHNLHGSQFSFLLTYQQLPSGDHRLIVIDILHHNDDSSCAWLGAWNTITITLVMGSEGLYIIGTM